MAERSRITFAIAAQPAVPADRFAHKIVRILTGMMMRSRQLNGHPFGTRGSAIAIPFSFWMWRIAILERAVCRSRGVPKLVVPVCYEGSLCGKPVVQAWSAGPLC